MNDLAVDLFGEPAPAPLEAVAAQINQAHADAQAYASKAVERALVAGDLLNRVKAELKHGEFLPWCKQFCPAINPRTLQNYMRVARELPAEIRSGSYLTIKEALRLVAGDESPQDLGNNFILPWLRSTDRVSIAATVREWPDLLHAATAYLDTTGLDLGEITQALGVYPDEVEPFVNTCLPAMDFNGIEGCAGQVTAWANQIISSFKRKAYGTALSWAECSDATELASDLRSIHQMHTRTVERGRKRLGAAVSLDWLMGKYLADCALDLAHFERRGFIVRTRALEWLMCALDYALLDTDGGIAAVWLGEDAGKDPIPQIPFEEARGYLDRTRQVVDRLRIPYAQRGTATLADLRAEKKRIWDNDSAISHGDASMLRLSA